MVIKEISITDLKPYENNPRRNNEAVEAVSKSIKEFGFKVPIVIDSENVIIAGHTRYKAAQKLGFESVPCVIADDLTPSQIKAYRLADNKTAELASWDFEKLDEELSALADLDSLTFNMADFGFVTGDVNIDDFFEEVNSTPQSSPQNNSPQNQADKIQKQTAPPQEIKSDTTIKADKTVTEKPQTAICPHCGKEFAL